MVDEKLTPVCCLGDGCESALFHANITSSFQILIYQLLTSRFTDRFGWHGSTCSTTFSIHSISRNHAHTKYLKGASSAEKEMTMDDEMWRKKWKFLRFFFRFGLVSQLSNLKRHTFSLVTTETIARFFSFEWVNKINKSAVLRHLVLLFFFIFVSLTEFFSLFGLLNFWRGESFPLPIFLSFFSFCFKF